MINYRLSAFVVKIFYQAKRQIVIDDEVLKKAINWMISHQASDGRFPEPGRVIVKMIQVRKPSVNNMLYVASDASFSFIYIVAVDIIKTFGYLQIRH